MCVLEPEVGDAVWEAVKALLPHREDNHPLGCRNPRIPDQVCFRGILIRLVTGVFVDHCRVALGRSNIGHRAGGPS